MKYLKMFEDKLYNESVYWLLPTDDRFEKSLMKIKCPVNRIILFLNNYNIKTKYIFVGYNANRVIYDVSNWNWGWERYRGYDNCDFYEENNYKFMGTINIDESELAANKFNI